MKEYAKKVSDRPSKIYEPLEIHELPDSCSLEDRIPQGTYDFPIAIFEDHMDRKPDGYVRLHWHEVLQFSYVIKGVVSFTVDSCTHVLRQGDGVFINSQALHMATAGDCPDSIYRCVNFSPRMLSGFGGSIINRKYVEPYIGKEHFSFILLPKDTIEDIEKIYRLCLRKGNGYELSVAGSIYQLWLKMVTGCIADHHTQKAAPESEAIKPLLNFIHANYMHTISLANISAAAMVSKSQCCRLFKKTAGMTPIEYLIRYRIEKSLTSLCTTDKPVSVIANESGFGDASYYIKCFKKITSMTPRQYRSLGNEHPPGEYLD